MKPQTLLAALALLIAVAGGVAQTKRNHPAREFMRDKLQLSQQILEGLATEDFDLIAAKAARLSAMSKQADWRVFENPDYDQQSATFRRHVDSLARSAREKNLDAATLAYVRITMSCVDCHKLVRGRLVTSRQVPWRNRGNETETGLGRAAGPAANWPFGVTDSDHSQKWLPDAASPTRQVQMRPAQPRRST